MNECDFIDIHLFAKPVWLIVRHHRNASMNKFVHDQQNDDYCESSRELRHNLKRHDMYYIWTGSRSIFLCATETKFPLVWWCVSFFYAIDVIFCRSNLLSQLSYVEVIDYSCMHRVVFLVWFKAFSFSILHNILWWYSHVRR